MLQSYVTPLPLALVALTQFGCLGLLFALLRTRPASVSGWRTVVPGGTHWFCFLGSWAFSTLVTWVWLFVGSARRDAESQIVGMLVLIFAFGAAALLSSAAMLRLYSMRLRWRGGVIRWLSAGREVTQQMSDFEAWRLPWSGLLHLRFEDGTDLKLDTYARNAEALTVAINERSGRRLDLL